AVRRAVVIRRDQERPGLLVVRPRHDQETGPFLYAWCTPVVDHFLDPMVGAEVDLPGVAGCVATIRGIFHHHPLAGTLPQGQLLRALVSDFGAGVPSYVKREE